jgi:hypothetical protein
LHEVEELARRIDDDGAGGFLAVIFDELPLEFRIERGMGGLARVLLRHDLLRLRRIERARIIALLRIMRSLLLDISKQRLDEAAAHVRPLIICKALLGRLRRGLIGVNDGRLGEEPGLWVSCKSLLDPEAGKRHARKEREGYVSEHRRTLHCFAVDGRWEPRQMAHPSRAAIKN